MIAVHTTAARSSAETAPDVERLKTYSGLKLALASQLYALRAMLKQRGHARRVTHCEELQVKLAEDRFILAVVGQFKRGKSSLLNAVIGRDVLPTGVLPLTSAITVLKFGPHERLVIERDGLRFPAIEPLERLADYVTEQGNPGNRKNVKTAVVEVPLPFLRRGLEFVDTPGVGSAIVANTATTYAFLPQCDAVLFVTSVDSPFTTVELEFLHAIRQHVRKIFFVVNKIDLLGEREQREMLEFISNTIRQHMGTHAVRLFPLSCTLGLAAKTGGDTQAYADSGLQALEEELGRFLVDDKAATFLASVADRALGLANEEASEVELAKHVRELPHSALQQRLDDVRHRRQGQAALRRDMFQKLRQQAVVALQTVLPGEIDVFLATQQAGIAPRLQRLLSHASWQPCALVSRRVSEGELRHLRRQASRWLAARAERLTCAAEDGCRALWDDLQHNLDEIPNLASAALGLGLAEHALAEDLPPWRLEAHIEPPRSTEVHWRAHLPWWLKPLPTRLAKSSLTKWLGREHAQLIASYKAPLRAAVEISFKAALDKLEDTVSSRATAIESRVQVTLEGKPPAESDNTALDLIRAKLLALRQEILGLPVAMTGASAQPPVSIAPIASPPTIEPSLEPSTDADIAKDLCTRGCPVCDHLRPITFNFFAQWQYALASDEPAQAQFAAEGGFCALHAWELEAISSPVGSSMGYPRLVERIARVLAQAAQSPDAKRALRQLLCQRHTCRACRLLRDAERRYTERLAAFLHAPHNRDAYAQSQGVCLRHLALLLAMSNREEDVPFLLSHAARRFEEVAEDMQAFALKTHALRRTLHNDDEADAYWRAITHIVGGKSVSVAEQAEILLGG